MRAHYKLAIPALKILAKFDQKNAPAPILYPRTAAVYCSTRSLLCIEGALVSRIKLPNAEDVSNLAAQ